MPDNSESAASKGWYSRFLPHRDEPGLFQFITYRLADSMPAFLLQEVDAWLSKVPSERIESERRRKFEEILDFGHGSGILRDPAAANCVIDDWRHFDGDRYDLIAFVVMPTHVHILIWIRQNQSLPKIVQSWKSHSGKRLKALFPHVCIEGEFWKREYWDRYIRDERHFHAAVEYVRQNPVKAELVRTPEDWPFSGVPGRTHPTFGTLFEPPN